MNLFIKDVITRICSIIPDEYYLPLFYRWSTGKKLNLKNPSTYNEKITWLKLYDHNPEYTTMVDKYLSRKYIEDKIGQGYTIPLLGVWDSVEEIDFGKLPNQFVLKCTHDSGGLIICKDKSKLDVLNAKRKLKKYLNHDFYLQGREWPYKNVKRRIIAEQYLEDKKGQLTDYKVFNFNGVPKLVQVDYDRFQGHKRQMLSPDWKKLPVSGHYKSDDTVILEKPEQWNEILELSKKLSSGLIHVRTDFFIVKGKVYVGELTFYTGSGTYKWDPESFDYNLGNWVDLSEISGGKIR